MTNCTTTKRSFSRAPVIIVEVPDTAYICQDWPKNLPSGATQKNVGEYITKGKFAHKDCKEKLIIVGEVQKETNSAITNVKRDE